MGMAAILVMWPGPFEQTFVPPSHRSSIWILTLIGQVVSEAKMFKECGGRRRTAEAYLLRWANKIPLGKTFSPEFMKILFLLIVKITITSDDITFVIFTVYFIEKSL